MKKNFSFFFLFFLVLYSYSQEIQLHYDPRHTFHSGVAKMNYVTATIQMFKPDKWGSTFGFLDMDFNGKNGNIGLAYLEISRNIKIGDSHFMPHVEFNGGVTLGDNNSGFSIPNAYLAGVSYVKSFDNGNFETYIAYKYNSFEKASNDVQWTVSWGMNFWNKKVTLSGFLDLWTENKDRTGVSKTKKFVLITEPQFWYNVNEHFSVGSEVEISNNFYAIYNNRVYVFPTLAAKWTF